ncbi:ABC transporter substrate-binding protein [Sulfitobacter sp. F26204]|uniref:ABC transporter substrate-binding protein n=1 Tax=Sulfitobacter sp. F26204 TaxID=2996014 RepID=UPI00225DED5F|nr:ABC transporter substrate-binding protein [Sulfitobacter sp. F26204]MCX7560502.1 ABC transporter substrate-binding protein [Sulfitobacter sp. F26204]
MTTFGVSNLVALLRAAAVSAAAIYAGGTASAADYDPGAMITVGSMAEPLTFDSSIGVQGIQQAFYGNVYEALFQLTDAGDVVKQLARDFTISEDRKTYTFTLQPDVLFHSGEPLTAADVKFSIERIRAEESKSARKRSLSSITSIETPDDSTVVITISEPSISLPYNLSYIFIVNDSAGDLSSTADGTGPYYLDSFRRGASVVLKPFADYWGDAPTNGGVTFSYFSDPTAMNNALLTGAIDISTEVGSPDALLQFANNPNFTIAEGTSTSREVFSLNVSVEPFSDKRVRKAISRAINKPRLLNAVWGDHGTLIGSFVPPTDPWFVDLNAVDAYDPESAKALMEEAGYKDGFKMQLETPNVEPHQIVAQILQRDLAEIGIDLSINLITPNEWFTKVYKARDFQGTLITHVNHRDIGFYGNPDFYFGYNNPEVVKLIADSETMATEAEQIEKLTQANKLIAEDAAGVWLFLNPIILVSSSNVTGYPRNALNSQFFAYDIKKAK